MSSEESEASRLKQNFGKDAEHTKVFESWDKSIQAFLLARAVLEDGELPVLAYCYQPTSSFFATLLMQERPAADWVLITTRRVFWCNPNEMSYELRNEYIDSVTFLEDKQIESSSPAFSTAESVHLENPSEDWMQRELCLRVVDFSGNQYKIFVDRKKALKIRNTIWQLSGGWRLAARRAEQENRENRNKFPVDDSPKFEKGTDAFRAARLQKAILKHGVDYSARFLDALAPAIQQFFQKQIEFEQGELPGFFFWENEETWIAATSRRVLWSRPGFKHQLQYAQIKEMGLSEMEKFGRQKRHGKITQKYIDEQLNESRRIKGTSPWFYFLDDKGNRYEALLPPGGKLFAIWNSILALTRLEE